MSASHSLPDGELNGLIKEYLEYFKLENSCDSFLKECKNLGIPIHEGTSKSKKRNKLIQIQDELLQCFDEGKQIEFFSLWKQHIVSKIPIQNRIMEKLEFQLQIHFAIFQFRTNHLITEDCESAMNYFCSYLETKGSSLSQSDDLLPYYALPYVANPHLHPTFKKLFEENWVAELKDQLEAYLLEIMKDLKMFVQQPGLIELYTRNSYVLKENSVQDPESCDDSNEHLVRCCDMQEEFKSMQTKWKEAEKRCFIQARQLMKLQDDCKTLMTVLTDFIAALESAVKGDLSDLDQLLSSCIQRFPQVFPSQKTVESTQISANTESDHQNYSLEEQQSSLYKESSNDEYHSVGDSVLDFTNIKNDFLTLDPKKTAPLLQALRWKLTKEPSKSLQLDVLTSYIENDVINCKNSIGSMKDLLDKITSSSIDIYQMFLRFVNSVASFSKGREYLVMCPEMLDFLQKAVSTKNEPDVVSFHMALASLRKLSERHKTRNILIEMGLVQWLIKELSEETCLPNYALYNLTKLLLNLCTHSVAKVQCKAISKQFATSLNSKFNITENDNYLQETTLAIINDLLQFLDNLSEIDDNGDGQNDKCEDNDDDTEELSIEPEIEENDLVFENSNEEYLEKYYSIPAGTGKSDSSQPLRKGREKKSPGVRHLSIGLKKSRRSKSVPLRNRNDDFFSDQQCMSEPLTPKLDPEATEMVRKIIGETSKTLVEATTSSHPSPVHIKGLNSKEYVVAFSSRPKILRTPEPEVDTPRSSTPISQTVKLKREQDGQEIASPVVALSSPSFSPI